MVRSMTGYGRGKEGPVTVEIRAVNHRYLDVSVRSPRICSYLEEPVKTLAGRYVSRGKVEIGITVENIYADLTRMTLNRAVLEGYLEAAALISSEYKLQNDLTVSAAITLPEVMSPVREEADAEEMTKITLAAAERALADFNDMRTREGARLTEDILGKADEIERLTALVEERMPQSVEAYRKRLEAKMLETLASTSIDESRILTETAIFADKVAVDEETVRLRSHIGALRGMLAGKGAVGRKLDFLAQEFGREANTIGSKCSDIETSRVVVDLKAEIEKIREQVQNIE